MKKAVRGIVAFILVLIIIIGFVYGKQIAAYIQYSVPNEDYFGNSYKEVLHIASSDDKEYALDIMQKVDDAFSYIGTKTTAETEYGELSRYSVTYEHAEKETHDLKFITADFDEDTGYVWFVYSQKVFGKDDTHISGSSDILVRLTLGKNENEWVIIDSKEHP